MNNIIFIIDNSQSVEPYMKDYIASINGILEKQKHINRDGLLTCVTFNDSINYLCINKAIREINREVSSDDIRPSGLTAFYDNISAILRNMSQFFSNNKQSPPVVIILTDGDDTSSRHLTERQTMLQVQMCKANGWKFIFLGVTEKSINLGRYLGFDVCILYNTKEKSFNDIPETVSHFLGDGRNVQADVDIRDLTDSMDTMNI